MRRIEFWDGFVFEISETAHSAGGTPMQLNCAISAATLRFNKSVVFRKNWYITDILNEKPKLFEREEESVLKETVEDVSLEFNGNFLIMRVVAKNSIKRFSYRAVSGKPDKNGFFDYSKERQAMRDIGPIPEGNYHIKPQEVQYITNRDNLRGIAGTFLRTVSRGNINRGTFQGGRIAWGMGRVWIYPRKVEVINPQTSEEIIRNDFSIHGGRDPGSAGCIDLTDLDKNFFEDLENFKDELLEISLTVKYTAGE
jgi:hypothetical protein